MQKSSHDFLDNFPQDKPIQRDYQLPRFIRVLKPSQRLVLAVFLFMDISILWFAVLALFGKISMPA
jgi:hypothetical protein